MKKLFAILGLIGLFTASTAFANPYDIHFNSQDGSDAPTTFDMSVANGNFALLSIDPDNGNIIKEIYPGDQLQWTGTTFSLNNIPIGAVLQLEAELDSIFSAHSTTTIPALQSAVSALQTTVSGISAGSFNVGTFMATATATAPYIASATSTGFMSAPMVSKLSGLSTSTATQSTNGLLSSTDKTKLDGLALPTQSAVSHSIVTGTGATGFQVSATRPSNNCYSVTVNSGSTLLAPVYGNVVFEIAATNSATAGDWTEVARTGGGDTVGLLHTGTATGQICAFVPAGYYSKLRSVNGAGTPTYSYNSGQEVIW